ncbi:sensor histidine kinase [Mesoterricola silvestris]|uniref:ATPase n=1 Tax=Mesoterricola silvestris TaxID=2927979 RepID=A0AA48K8C8_9BACT|nr:histidine kinase [Mesoterricola silvestris]BDU72784.1 ATPase [Mesoterricola silvestris]
MLLCVSLLFTAVALRAYHRLGVAGNPWILGSAALLPAFHLATIVLAVPMAWRIRARGWPVLVFAQRLVVALALSEAACALIVLLDLWVRGRAGMQTPNAAGVMLSYLFVVAPAMTAAGGLVAARANAMDEKEAMVAEANIARTRLLQSQLHPHVLFNALNGLAELIHKDPPTAEQSVKHLADLLRRILRASETPTFSLGEERALVEDYLFIEGLRLGLRLRLQWDWDASLDGQQVPPLLIQPLVENAIKHGIAPNRGGGELLVRVGRDGRDLILEVWNTGAAYEARPGSGIGLRNLEARLALHFGLDTAFSIQPDKGGTLASIRLPGVLLH